MGSLSLTVANDGQTASTRETMVITGPVGLSAAGPNPPIPGNGLRIAQKFAPQEFGSRQFGSRQFGSRQFGSREFGSALLVPAVEPECGAPQPAGDPGLVTIGCALPPIAAGGQVAVVVRLAVGSAVHDTAVTVTIAGSTYTAPGGDATVAGYGSVGLSGSALPVDSTSRVRLDARRTDGTVTDPGPLSFPAALGGGLIVTGSEDTRCRVTDETVLCDPGTGPELLSVILKVHVPLAPEVPGPATAVQLAGGRTGTLDVRVTFDPAASPYASVTLAIDRRLVPKSAGRLTLIATPEAGVVSGSALTLPVALNSDLRITGGVGCTVEGDTFQGGTVTCKPLSSGGLTTTLTVQVSPEAEGIQTLPPYARLTGDRRAVLIGKLAIAG